MKNLIVTLAWLEANGACLSQTHAFEKAFGKRAVIDVPLMAKHAPDFDLCWLAARVLSRDNYWKFRDLDTKLTDKWHKKEGKLRDKYFLTKTGKRRVNPDFDAYNKEFSRLWKADFDARQRALGGLLLQLPRRSSSARRHKDRKSVV